MELKELRQFCCDRIANGHKTITLETESTRLLVSHGPIGELCCINKRGKHVVLYDALKVLQFLDKLENQEIKSKIRSKEMTKKDFPTLAVLSITSGRLLTQPKDASEGNGFDQIYEVLEWMTDDLPNRTNWDDLAEDCKQWIYQWHPEIIEADRWIENKLTEKCEVEDVKDCQAAMLAKFGEWIEIYGNAFPS